MNSLSRSKETRSETSWGLERLLAEHRESEPQDRVSPYLVSVHECSAWCWMLPVDAVHSAPSGKLHLILGGIVLARTV